MFGNTFIKANYDFGMPWCVFEVGHRQVYVESHRGDPLFLEVRNALKQWSPDYGPNLKVGMTVDDRKQHERECLSNLEMALLAIIERERPALKGGSVIAIDFGRGGMKWEITFVHPKLPRHREYGSFLPRIPLVIEPGLIPGEQEQRYLDELNKITSPDSIQFPKWEKKVEYPIGFNPNVFRPWKDGGPVTTVTINGQPPIGQQATIGLLTEEIENTILGVDPGDDKGDRTVHTQVQSGNDKVTIMNLED